MLCYAMVCYAVRRYLANYSMGQCMLWGFQQGCNYVKTRCGTGVDDHSSPVTAGGLYSPECAGSPVWAMYPDSDLASLCAGGNDPCGTTAKAGFAFGQCNAQCYTPQEERNCSTSPETPPASAAKKNEKTFLGPSPEPSRYTSHDASMRHGASHAATVGHRPVVDAVAVAAHVAFRRPRRPRVRQVQPHLAHRLQA